MRLIAIATFAAGLALASAASAAPNLITNGDFSGGNSGFTSDYTFVTPPGSPTSLEPEGTYTIGADPNAVHPSWVHVAGDNPMLIFNGATSGNETAWEEDGIFATGGTYNFSANVMDICCNSSFDPNHNAPSDLQFQVSTNGGSTWTTIVDYTTSPGGDATHPSGDEGILETVNGTFTLPTGNFDIRAIDGFSAAGGNDFALDNISVTAAPEPATWGLMILGVGMAGGALRFRRKSDRPALVRIA